MSCFLYITLFFYIYNMFFFVYCFFFFAGIFPCSQVRTFSFPILTTDATGLMMIFPFFHTSFTSSRSIDDICFWRLFWQRLKYIYSAANICIAVTIMQNIVIAHMFWCVKNVSLPKWRCSTYFQCTHIFGVSNIFLWREPVIFIYRSSFFEHIFLNEMLR